MNTEAENASRPEGYTRAAQALLAAGHPNGVFKLSPQQRVQLTGAPVADVVVVATAGAAS